jgi:hypothetical protein
MMAGTSSGDDERPLESTVQLAVTMVIGDRSEEGGNSESKPF